MVSVCFYFQVHQPFRLCRYNVFDIGKNHQYFDERLNNEILNKVSEKCYLPTNKLLLELLNKHPEFRISFSFSGVILEQFEKQRPDVLKSFKKLVETKRAEIISETYYHGLSSIYSKPEFVRQVKLHSLKIKSIFGMVPRVFRNTELIYNNAIAGLIESLGYKGMMAEGADKVLDWRSPNFIYQPPKLEKLKLLLKNYRLSDDLAFRFSNKSWKEYPLTIEKYADWINKANGNGNIINLFMDYETFGEHQWEDSGIFEFLKKLPGEILKRGDGFMMPSEAISNFKPVGEFDSPDTISWADVERDVSAWVGNDIQRAAIDYIYELEESVLKTKDAEIIEDWRKLQISDHFYYMCTKWFSDGDVHKYFNPYDTPYDAFINYINILNDLVTRIELKNKAKIASRKIEEFRMKKNGEA